MKRSVLRIDFEKYLLCLVVGVAFSYLPAGAQLSKTGFLANFGIDADTRADYTKLGAKPNSNTGDDWFSYSSSRGSGVIDTTDASFYKAQLKNNRNICFLKYMSAPLYSKMKGNLWLDAVYIHDYTSASGKDSTSFGTSAKNGMNPIEWNGTPTSIPNKTDIVDAYAHFRRNGNGIKDSLWLFTGVSTIGTNGDRYFDIELFKKRTSYNMAAGRFTAAGLNDGRTEWLFDPLGNIIQTGDLIISVSYKSGQAPDIDVRIWVSRTTYQTARTAGLKFGTNFDGGLLYGYADIKSLNNKTDFGAGAGNFNGSSNTDSTFSTPWGTINGSGNWSQNYDQLQFVEIGLNLTRMGIDPALYSALNPCERIFHSLFFKSRSSNSFSANLQDFAGPIDFSVPSLDFSTNGGAALTCANPVAQLSITNPPTVGEYSWTTPDGHIIGSNIDSSVIQVDKKGLYILSARIVEGCPVIRQELMNVTLDNTPPEVMADFTLTPDGQVQLLGEDVTDPTISNTLAPSGASKGLQWSWKGPNSFTSLEQNPIINMEWVWGAYYLEVTEMRNGCKAYASLDISFRKKETTKSTETKPQMQTGPSEKMCLQTSGGKLFFVANQEQPTGGFITVHTVSGQLLMKKPILLTQGHNSIDLPVTPSNKALIVSVYLDQKLSYVRKLVY